MTELNVTMATAVFTQVQLPRCHSEHLQPISAGMLFFFLCWMIDSCKFHVCVTEQTVEGKLSHLFLTGSAQGRMSHSSSGTFKDRVVMLPIIALGVDMLSQQSLLRHYSMAVNTQGQVLNWG